MAIGDTAAGLGWPLVPDTGEEGRIRHGARELNRTRDMAAEAFNAVPNSKTNFQKASGIRYGEGNAPADWASQGNLWIQIHPNGLVFWMYVDGTWRRHHYRDN